MLGVLTPGNLFGREERFEAAMLLSAGVHTTR